MTSSPTYLTNERIAELISMPEAVAALERAFAEEAEGSAGSMERTRVLWDGGSRLQALGGYLDGAGFAAAKCWTVAGGKGHPIVALFSSRDGSLQALMDATELGRLRTGAASGLATKLLASPDASTLALIGTGRQAPTQAEAVAAVRKLEHIFAVGRDPERTASFARMLGERMGIPVEPSTNVAAATRHADIVTAITNAEEPVVTADDLQPGTHVNGAGAILPRMQELDASIFARAEAVVVDSPEQAAREAGDIQQALESGAVERDRLVPLSQAVADGPRDASDGITVFKSVGVGLEDVALATLAWQTSQSS